MQKKALVGLVVLALSLFGSACSNERHQSSTAPAAVAPAPPPGGGGALPSADRSLRITVDLTIEVSDLNAGKAGVRSAVGRANGYVSEASESNHYEEGSATFEAHVPVPNLPAFRAEVGKLGKTTNESERSEDVTEARVDLEARLGNARATERRLLDLLDKRAGTLADVIAIEKELSSVRENIERLTAEERMLAGRIQHATVKILLQGHDARSSSSQLGSALGDGVRYAGLFIFGVAMVVARTGPTLLLLGLFGLGVYGVARLLQRGNRRK